MNGRSGFSKQTIFDSWLFKANLEYPITPQRHTNTIQNIKDIMKCYIDKRHCTTNKTAVEGRSSSYVRLLS